MGALISPRPRLHPLRTVPRHCPPTTSSTGRRRQNRPVKPGLLCSRCHSDLHHGHTITMDTPPSPSSPTPEDPLKQRGRNPRSATSRGTPESVRSVAVACGHAQARQDPGSSESSSWFSQVVLVSFGAWTVHRPFPQLNGELQAAGLTSSVEVMRDERGSRRSTPTTSTTCSTRRGTSTLRTGSGRWTFDATSRQVACRRCSVTANWRRTR